jgi:hypothetical protein
MDAAQPLQSAKEVVMAQHAADLTKVEFGTFRRPEAVVEEAAHVARVFQDKMNTILDANKEPILYRMFNKSRHITRPGWQLLGSMYRVTAGIVPGSSQFREFPGNINGWEATAEAIYVPTGARISTADGMCLNDEPNWDERPTKNDPHAVVPLFQLRSMAQTRACSKVLSNLLSYVAIMAGCSGTSAEEMSAEPMLNGNGQTTSSAAPQRAQANGNGTISEPMVRRLFGLNKGAGRSREGLGVILAAHGYSDPNGDVEAACYQVKKADFDKIQAEVMKPL